MTDKQQSSGDDEAVGFDRSPSEVFDGPAHALNLGVNQSAFVNDQKKRELEDAFEGRYAFEKIEHHGTLSPIEGDHEFAWEVRNAADVEDRTDDDPTADGSVRDTASDDQSLSDEPEEGLKS